MPYSLNFSDPGNLNTITVPDYPPGINAVDTSLSLVGKAYPNYGQVMDQNLLKLLENFASPNAPYFPIKGQLWYDSYSQSLKLFDGNVWKSSNGIYQQAADPSVASSVSTGDIWVDTTTASLKIRSSGAWIKVGPTVTTSTGINVETLSVGATTKTVLSVYVNGTVVAIFNNDTAFTPTTIPGNLQGFTEIGKGITLPESSPNAYTLKGTADNASKLGGVSSDSYLRKNDSSAGGQIITGKVVYETSALSGGENRDGVIIRTAGENPSLNYIQFFKQGSNAIISNQVKSGKFIVKIKGVNDTSQTDAVTVEKNKVTISGDISATSINGLNTTGTVQIWAGSTSTTLPLGWLLCNGAQVSTSTYSSLYSLLGNIYGPATGGQFYLPNLYTTVKLPVGSLTTTTNVYHIIKT